MVRLRQLVAGLKKNSKSKISTDQFSFEFKGKKYDLRLFEDENLNHATQSVMIDGIEKLVPVDNITAYTGYVVGDPKSRVSLIVSDSEIAGFIRTAETTITLEPLSFYGQQFSGERQIMYDISDLEFEMTFNDLTDEVSKSEDRKLREVDMISDGLIPSVYADTHHDAQTIIVTDDDYYNVNTSNCTSRILTVVGGMNLIYADTNVGIDVLSTDCVGETYLSDTTMSGYSSDLKNHLG